MPTCAGLSRHLLLHEAGLLLLLRCGLWGGLHGHQINGYAVGALVQQLKVGVLAVHTKPPQTVGAVSICAGEPSRWTRLPLLSISSCCKYAGRWRRRLS